MKTKFDPFLKSTNVRSLRQMFKALNIILGVGQWVFPGAVADFVRKKFFTPQCKPLSSQKEQWLQKAEPFEVPFHSTHLCAWKIGSGPAILFAHGWNGRGVEFYPFFQKCLDAGYSVLFYDATAHGKSGGDMTNYLDMTDCFKTIKQYDFGSEIAGVVAHSMGAGVAINQLSYQPADIPIVCIAPALKLFELLFQSFQYHGIPKNTYINLILEVEEQYQIPLETRNPIDLIRKLKNDILIIHDESDKITPIGPSISVNKEHGNVRLMKTKGLGHSFILKNPEVVKKSIKFIQNQGIDRQKPEAINDMMV